ncbi:MAG TPA: amidohydrolase family protein [Thermoanaerobaculia bacterium]|nr:amidohydrolase family protein [Thermoanaerobaculia bacterium]
MKRTLVAFLLAGATALGAETIALVGGTVHPVSGPDLPNGTVVITDGKIAAVGANVPVPAGAKVVDVSGKHVYPTLVPAATNLGLVEISAARATVDTTETGDVNPDARADVAMNFDSELLPVTRSAGVLVAGVTPTGGIVSGSGAAMKLDGWTREDAALRAPAFVTVTWPNLSIDRSPQARFSVRIQEKRRDEALAKLKDVFAEARGYGKARAAEGKAGVPRHDFDPRLEALLPVIDGKIPVLVIADRLAQIRAALAWAKEEGLKIVIGGGRDAWRAASELATAGVPIVLDPVIGLPTRADEPYDAPFAAPGILAKAGVRVAIAEGDSQFARNLAHHASVAAAYGMPRDQALAAITLEPARILGIADRVGSLEPGKDATLFVSDRDVLDFRHTVLAAYVDGRALELSDKHKRLYERYRNRPKPGVR